jgi:hypothetical protein
LNLFEGCFSQLPDPVAQGDNLSLMFVDRSQSFFLSAGVAPAEKVDIKKVARITKIKTKKIEFFFSIIVTSPFCPES